MKIQTLLQNSCIATNINNALRTGPQDSLIKTITCAALKALSFAASLPLILIEIGFKLLTGRITLNTPTPTLQEINPYDMEGSNSDSLRIPPVPRTVAATANDVVIDLADIQPQARFLNYASL